MKKSRYIFSVRIFLPALLTMALFLLTFFFMVLPAFEKNMMDRKRETIYELTQVACSILDKYNSQYKAGQMSLEKAKELAAEEVGSLRYGDENKDYFWITDMYPRMILHPYRPDLNGQDLRNIEDPEGTKLFVEFVSEVEKNGEGYVDYMWQWKDDTSRIVPKLSYVRGFHDWGWIVGTGIYVEDVRVEIHKLERSMVWISLIIFGVLLVLLVIIMHFGLRAERRRVKAEEDLKKSRSRYRALIDTSSEGTLLLLETEVFVNRSFLNITGIISNHPDKAEVISVLHLEKAFSCDFSNFLFVKRQFSEPQKAEILIQRNDGAEQRLLVNASMSTIMDREALVVVVRPLHQAGIAETGDYSSLILPELKIGTFVSTFSRRSRFLDLNPYLVDLMEADTRDDLLNRDIRDFFSEYEEQHIFLKTLLKNEVIHDFIIRIVTVKGRHIYASVSARIYEDEHSETKLCSGVIRPVTQLYSELIQAKELLLKTKKSAFSSADTIVNSLKRFSKYEDLRLAYSDFVLLLKSMAEDGLKAEKITALLAGFSDDLIKRLVQLALDKLGEPPCEFAYLSLGSVGRGEQTFVTDQDNAIIFEDGHDNVKHYFLALGKYISDLLNESGFQYCNGGMMASNPRWCVSLSEWKAYFKEWFSNSDPQNLMEVSVFFDFKASSGNLILVENLRDFVNSEAENKSAFYFNMAQSILQFRPPVSLMGNISGSSSESDSFDIKMTMLPLVMIPRIYSIKNKIEARNTFDRICVLRDTGVFTSDFACDLLADYRFLMSLRLSNQVKLLNKGMDSSNIIHFASLNDLERNTLQRVFSHYRQYQTKLKSDFTGTTL